MDIEFCFAVFLSFSTLFSAATQQKNQVQYKIDNNCFFLVHFGRATNDMQNINEFIDAMNKIKLALVNEIEEKKNRENNYVMENTMYNTLLSYIATDKTDSEAKTYKNFVR